MSDTSEAETYDDGPSSQLIFGSGQSLWLALVTVIAVLALAFSIVAIATNTGDSGGGGTAGAAVTDTPAIVAGPGGDEFVFDPTDVAVPADVEVTVDFSNEGTQEHNWTVLAAGEAISSEADFDESMVLFEVGALAGEAASGSASFAAGDYQVICTIGGHFDAGMEGTLEAVAAEGEAEEAPADADATTGGEA